MALIACLLLGPLIAHAQSAQLEIAQFGWRADGTLSPRGWNPVIVRVGGANEAAARVQVTLKLSVGSATATFVTPVATYAQDVALPSGTTREVKLWLPVPGDGAYLITAQLLNSSGQVLAEQSTSTPQVARADGAPLIATLADHPGLSAQLGRIEVPYQQGLTAQVRSIDLPAADVPARPEYLTGFQGMVVQGDAAATLTLEQKRAIQQWVALGGHLVVMGGAQASRTAAVLDGADDLGAQFGQVSADADLQPLSTWVGSDAGGQLASGTAAQIQSRGAELLAGSPDHPLAVRASWGEGSVTLLAVDPSLQPLRGWSGTVGLLARALQPALTNASANAADTARPVGPRQDDTRLLSAIDALPTYAFPDWKQIALLLGGFAFFIGPVLHLVLWRMGRRPWLWIAVPVLSIAVTAAIYVGSALQPGHDVVANVISEVRIDSTTGDARQAMAVGFFAPLHDRLSVRIAGEVPVRVAVGPSSTSGLAPPTYGFGGQSYGYRTGSLLPGYTVVTGRETQVDYTSDASYDNGLRSLVLSRALPRGSIGQLEADLRVEGADGIVTGSVHNATPYAYDQVGLAIGQTISRVGPMAPGQTASISFDPRAAPPMAPGNLAYSFAWQLFGLKTPASGTSTNLDLPADPETRRQMRIVDAVFSSNDRNGAAMYSGTGLSMARPSTARPMLVALTTDAVGGDLLPSAGAQRVYQSTVVEVPVHLTVAPGPFTMPSTLMPPSVGVDTGGSLNMSTTGIPAWLDLRGTATYTFRLNLPLHSRVDRLNVTMQQVSSGPVGSGPGSTTATLRSTPNAQTAQGRFSIYNWRTASWQALSAGGRDVVLSPAQEYIGPDSSLRIQVSSGGTDRVVRFLQPEFTIQGEAGS